MKQTLTTPPVPDSFPDVLRILLVDDSVVLLEHLRAYLKTQPSLQVIGTAPNGSYALHMAELLAPDLVLMDLRIPVMDGLQAMAILHRRKPNMRIVIMSMDHSPGAEAEARAHGAHGFIWKPRIMSDLKTELRRAFLSDSTKDGQSISPQDPTGTNVAQEAGRDGG